MQSNAVDGHVRTILRLEGLAVLVSATALYFLTGGIWWFYLLLLFAPDLSFFGYAAGNRIGATVYNLLHTYIVPVLLGLLAYMLQLDWLLHVALIHLAHIGLDRSLGYGLKYATGFAHTHLGELKGRRS